MYGLTKGIYGRAVRTGGSFYVLCELERYKERMMKKEILWLTDPKELPGKISVRLFRTARPGLAVSGKIILAALRYFPRKPCISGVGRCNALVVHRAARPGYQKQ